MLKYGPTDIHSLFVNKPSSPLLLLLLLLLLSSSSSSSSLPMLGQCDQRQRYATACCDIDSLLVNKPSSSYTW